MRHFSVRVNRVLLAILLFIIISQSVEAQIFQGKRDKINTYDYALRINEDSTVIFIYSSDRNLIYAEYRGKIYQVNDTNYRINAQLSIGQFPMKAKTLDSIHISLDSSFRQSPSFFAKAIVIYPQNKGSQYCMYFTKNQYGISTYLDKTKYNSRKGTDVILLAIGRKNPISGKFLDFEIPYGSSAALQSGDNIDINIYLKNGVIRAYTTYNQLGHFRLKRKSGI